MPPSALRRYGTRLSTIAFILDASDTSTLGGAGKARLEPLHPKHIRVIHAPAF
jgi:hypothetical protein